MSRLEAEGAKQNPLSIAEGLQFPEGRLSSGVIEGLLAAVGNDESKALTAAALEPGVYYTRSTLAKRILKLLGPHQLPYDNSPDAFYNFCRKSFVSFGIVDMKESSEDTPESVKGSDFALLAASFAGHIATFSESHPDLALKRFLGKTSSTAEEFDLVLPTGKTVKSKKRQPRTRYNIFQTLLASEQPLRMVDLAQNMNESRLLLKKHLDVLNYAGILSYESVRADEPYLFYKSGSKEPPEGYFKTHPNPQFAQDLYAVVLAHQTSSSGIGVEQIVQKILALEGRLYKSYSSVNQGRNAILKRLVRDGILAVEKFDISTRSAITMSSDQRQLVEEFVTLIRRFQEGDRAVIEEGLAKAQAILSDPDRVVNLMQKAKEASADANETPSAELHAAIIQALREFPGSEAPDLQAILETRFVARHFAPTYISYVLNALKKTDAITSIKRKGRTYWHVQDEKTIFP